MKFEAAVASNEIADDDAASTAKALAEAISATESLTGVKATAQTNARLTVTPDDNTNDYKVISFELKGMNDTAKIISASITMGTGDGNFTADLSDLRDKINGYTGTTGIYAKLSSDKSYIDIESPDGHDIVIDDFDMPANTETSQTQATVPAGNIADGSGHTIFTSGSAHGFETGDMVRASELTSSSTPTASGVSPAQIYFVTKLSDTTFKLSTGSQSGTSVDLTEASGDDPATALKFTKVQKTMNFQTMDRDGNLKGAAVQLFDQDLGKSMMENYIICVGRKPMDVLKKMGVGYHSQMVDRNSKGLEAFGYLLQENLMVL